ncbi:cupin domain-containing protein [Hymenobacter convexus]|uniref:cupin domain-containing protein n=1 Tax=Hymenobacter sp. CA1UV-4 TaxID=3063782 RepID=UPI00271269C3|nr:cupin domain-containing protein [Hymenobacter sp. CA1UV-4]MDO7851483.1 cupin domain-containing protein [Hymenobacter sp. CA1UV-4]
MKTSTRTAKHYTWGAACDGWHLLKSDSLSVIQERIPPGTAEQRHYHARAQQVFFVLAGEATFEVGEETVRVAAQESLHIPPGTPHRIANQEAEDLHFLVISEPKAHGDRVTT